MQDFDYPGVYGLSVDGKILYVGSSRNIKKRLQTHFSNLRNGKHKRELQEAYNAGKEVVPICLQRLTEDDCIGTLYSSEMYWIDKLSPICTDKKPLSEYPIHFIERAANDAMERRLRSETPENDYMKMHHENIENEFYSRILIYTERFLTPIKNEKEQSEDMYDCVIIRFSHEERLKINKAARKRTKSTERFIKEILRDCMESENP